MQVLGVRLLQFPTFVPLLLVASDFSARKKMKAAATILLLALSVVAVVFLQHAIKNRLMAGALRERAMEQREEPFAYPDPPEQLYESQEEKRKAYEIALKELRESKIEIVELEHDHLQCILNWEIHRSHKKVEKALEKMISEGVEKISSQSD